MIKRLWQWLPTGIYVLLLIYFCAFKVGNTDFWWHIKAGQMMRESGWITTDPFAYTRIDQPYLATHPWFAQVILSLFYDLGGFIGITLLRTIFIILTFGIPLLLARRHLWMTGAVAVLAAVGTKPAFSDRPQLFTFLFFSLTASLCAAYLDADDRKKRSILILLPIIIIAWSNMHGAASITGIALFGALFVQRLWSKISEWKALSLCLIAMCIGTLLTPNVTSNITYLFDLSKENASNFIVEWQPAVWSMYLKHTALLWIISIASLLLGRKNLLFSCLTLFGIGHLSRTAGRHEALFLITALVITVYQLKHSQVWDHIVMRLHRTQPPSLKLWRSGVWVRCILGIFGLLGLIIFTYIRSYDIDRNDHLFGYGVFAPVQGASQHIKRENITGNLFNNYNAGGELLFHDHAVFLDGRNLDYGYEYINIAVNAGVDSTEWKRLENQHDFTHAVIYYDLQAELTPIPYVDQFDKDANWFLTYLDDWAAVYERATPQRAIRTVTPRMLHHQLIPEVLKGSELKLMEEELKAMIEKRPDGVKPRLYLAKLYTALQGYNQAEEQLREALTVQPKNYLIHLGMMKLHMEQGQWNEAWKWLKKAKWFAGFTGVDINEELVSKIKNRAKR